MKRIIILLASAALIAAGFQVVPASAAAEKDVKFFLHSTGCPADGVNSDYLSITDADNDIECFYTASGARNEVGASQATPATPEREAATRYWDSTDGDPVVLDASRPVAGKIFTAGGACAVSVAPCSPAGLSGGEVILDLALVGTSGGTEIELGTQTETFNAAPGGPHETEVNIQPDAGLSGKTFETIELRTWIHGKSLGHGVIKTNGDHSSFISVPTAGAKAKKTPPGKNNPPGKKKGCKKGKGKKRGCEGKGKKSPKPGKPAASCAPFTPGEKGAGKPTVKLTDAATEEEPAEQTVTLEQSTADVEGDPTYDHFNVVVDSKAADAGLYATLEFAPRRDYDLELLHTDGSYAARSHGFNPMAEIYSLDQFNEGHGGHTTASSESLVGIKTSDCGGWTIETVNWLGEGGELTVTLWLGEAQIDPQEEGAET